MCHEALVKSESKLIGLQVRVRGPACRSSGMPLQIEVSCRDEDHTLICDCRGQIWNAVPTLAI